MTPDATSDSETLGKPVGNDVAAAKSTYVALYGIEGAQTEAKRHTEAALTRSNPLVVRIKYYSNRPRVRDSH